MLMKGRNVTAPNDELQPMEIFQFYKQLVNPPSELCSYISMLRQVKQIDPKAYSQQKRNLPYVVCGKFYPPKRKNENFISTSCFIIDIDHIEGSDTTLDTLRLKFKNDPRVALFFISPSQDGLKVLYTLSKPLTDKAVYSLFYKNFIRELAQQMGLETLIDTRVHDVARACFMSHDPEAWYNPSPTPIDPEIYLPKDSDIEWDEQIKVIREDIKESRPKEVAQGTTEISDESWARIKKLLEVRRPTKNKEVYVPEALKNIEEKLKPMLEAVGVTLEAAKNIQYGKKIMLVTPKQLKAELNIYFGKKGYSVIVVEKNNTHKEFANDCRTLIINWLEEQEMNE